MTPERTKVVLDQNSTFELVVTWLDASGVPVDITDYEAKLVAKASYDADAEVLFTLTDGTGEITLGGDNGVITCELPPADTADLTPGNYVYDLLVKSGGGKVYKVLAGDLVVRPGVAEF